MSSRKTFSRSQNKRRNVRPAIDIMKPRQINSNIRVSHRYRFVSTSGTATAVTGQSLLGALGVFPTIANSTVAAIFGSVRIKNLEMWTTTATLGSAVTCSVEWAGSATNSGDIEISDTSVSTASPAHINSRPPKNSLASFWSTATTGQLFVLTAPAGTIIDVVVEMTMFDDTNGSNAAIGVATAALGNVYYLSLDPNASHRYPPVSLTTTI